MKEYPQLRCLTPEEAVAIKRLARQPAKLRVHQRALLISLMADNPALALDEACFQAGYMNSESGKTWVERFNQDGIQGLLDKPRTRKVEANIGAKTKLLMLTRMTPVQFGFENTTWTLNRLQTVLNAHYQIHLSKTTIADWLKKEGVDLRKSLSNHTLPMESS